MRKAMCHYIGSTLGEGEHVLSVLTGTPLVIEIANYPDEDGNPDYEVVVRDLTEPDADIPLESVVDFVERRTGAVGDYLLPPISSAEYEALKASILTHGVMNPILVDARGNVIEGRQRQRICRELGKNCPTTVMGKISVDDKRQLTLELNLCRRHVGLPAKKEVARILLRRGPWLSDRAIGQQAGIDHKTVASLRSELGTGGEIPHLIHRTGRDGKRYPTITVQTAGAVERAKKALQQLGSHAADKPIELRCAERLARRHRLVEHQRHAVVSPATSDAIQIINGDFRQLPFANGAAGLAFTDPPYLQEYLSLWDDLGAFAAKALRPGGLLLAYSGIMHLDRVMASLAKHLSYYWQLALLHDSGRVSVHKRHVYSRYKAILIYSNGEATDTPWIDDVIYGSGKEKQLHDWQQSLAEAQSLIQRLSKPGDLIIDPFGGSFTTAEAVLRVGGGRRFWGCDVDQGCVIRGQQRIAEAQRELRA